MSSNFIDVICLWGWNPFCLPFYAGGCTESTSPDPADAGVDADFDGGDNGGDPTDGGDRYVDGGGDRRDGGPTCDGGPDNDGGGPDGGDDTTPGINYNFAEITGTPNDMDALEEGLLVYIADDTKELGTCPISESIESVTCETIPLPSVDNDDRTLTLMSHVDMGNNISLVTFAGQGADPDDTSLGWISVNRSTGEIVNFYSFTKLERHDHRYITYPTLSAGALIAEDSLFLTMKHIRVTCAGPGGEDCTCGCYESVVGAVYVFPRCEDGNFATQCGTPDDSTYTEYLSTIGYDTTGIAQIDMGTAILLNSASPGSIDLMSLTFPYDIDYDANTPLGNAWLQTTPDIAVNTDGDTAYVGVVSGDPSLLVADLNRKTFETVPLPADVGYVSDVLFHSGTVYVTGTAGTVIVDAVSEGDRRAIDVGVDAVVSAIDRGTGLLYIAVMGDIGGTPGSHPHLVAINPEHM